MAKKLVLPEHDLPIDPEDAGFDQRSSYEAFLDYFKSIIPEKDLATSIKKFEDERDSLNKAIKHSLSILREQSLLAGFLIWNYLE